MSGSIFINYRRDDSAGEAGRLYDLLALEFSRKRVFMDVDDIPLGVDFADYLEAQVANCQIMVSLIGPQWLELLQRRRGDPTDFVRIEIEAALKRNILIPVLIRNAAMPREDQLPEPLKPLVRRNAAQLRHDRFGADGASLVQALKETLGMQTGDIFSATPQQQPRTALGRTVISGDRASRVLPGSGESFQDEPFAPEMVVVPAGEFWMGSPDDEPRRSKNEGPLHRVMIRAPFAVSRFAVTFDEWDTATSAGCVGYKPSDNGWGRGERPVIHVNWNDAQAYVKWLRQKTGKAYRLLSEAEWEYAARAGTSTQYWWGDSISRDQANYDTGPFTALIDRKKTVPVRSFKPNPWGLYQVHGNVWEWVEDCWNDNYKGAPQDGSAWNTGDCSSHVLRGGARDHFWWRQRSAFRFVLEVNKRQGYVGFRIARTL